MQQKESYGRNNQLLYITEAVKFTSLLIRGWIYIQSHFDCFDFFISKLQFTVTELLGMCQH